MGNHMIDRQKLHLEMTKEYENEFSVSYEDDL
jgi:hypothetical protein